MLHRVQVRDSSRPATAGNRTNTSPPPPGANIAWNQDRAVLPEPNISPGNATNSPASVLLEELDLALLQEGCIVNFCSLFFDSPEPFSVFAFSAKTQVFSISKSELFKHMPPSELQAYVPFQLYTPVTGVIAASKPATVVS